MDDCRAIVLDTARGSKYIERPFSLSLMLFKPPFTFLTTEAAKELSLHESNIVYHSNPISKRTYLEGAQPSSTTEVELTNLANHVFEL